MIKKNINFVMLLVILNAVHVHAQNSSLFSLEKAIELAKENSLDAEIAVNIIKTSYWNYKNYTFSSLPKLSLNGTIPNYFRSINRITLPSGENSFVPQNIAYSNLNLAVSQNIGLTGGTISMGSSLERIDNFNSPIPVSYSSAPFLISYNQNTIFYNEYRWQRKIQPLKYEEAKREYRERLEDIAYITVDIYFSLLIAQTQLKLDQQNLQNIDTLLNITKTRAARGSADMKILLQTELNFLNAKKSLAIAVFELEVARQNFIRHLKLDKNQSIELQSPDQIIAFEIKPDEALVYAQHNRKAIIEFQRRRVEAEQAVARTKAETGPSVSLRTNFGLTQTGNTIGGAYADPLNRQSLEVSFNIPLLDWGVNKSNRKLAEAHLELEKSNIEQEEFIIEQEIFLQTMMWDMVIEQMEMVRETSAIAQEYYNIARERYYLGNVSLTDLNQAQLEKDKAILDYLSNLKNYWSLYFLMRKLTLYDFMNKKPLDVVNLEFK